LDFLIVVQPTESGYQAHAPDVDGCVATGRSSDQAERQIRAVLEFHVMGLRQAGKDPPEPKAYATKVEVGLAALEVLG